MKKCIASLLVSLPVFLLAQGIDSIAMRQVDSLVLVSRDFTGKMDYDKALEVNSEAENIALKVFGRNSVAYGNCMFNRGRINYFKRDFAESENWYLESISIRENVLGSEHPEYIRSKSNLAILYKNMGQYEKAERLFQETLATRKKVLGNSHIDYATNLNNLANLYLEMGQYDTAVNHFKESLAIINELLGKENEEYASILNNLAIAYLNMGRFENAEDLYKEALKICEKNLGKEHPDYAGTLNNLAIVYFNLGYYELAEDHYKETLIIREKVIGKEHSEYASSLNNLAILYYTMGLYEKAEPLSLESISILENIVGTEHPEYVSNLSNLAALYFDMGNYEKAELLLQETKAVREKVLGKEHPDYAWSLDNLANLYYMQGKFSLAEDLYTEALMIRENQIGKDHPDYAASLHNLSSLHFTLGQYEKSETFSLNAKNVYEKVFGIDHPLYARTLKNLADNYFAAGQYERSERLFKDALSINLATFGLQHHEYIRNLKNLANLYEVQNRYTESEPLLDMYFKLTQSRLTQSATFLSERELTNYTNTYRVASSDLKSYLHSRVVNNQQTGSLTDLAYNQALFEKGFLLTAASRLNALTTSTTESQEIMKQLKGYRRRIAAEISKPITDRIGLDELEEKANNVEKELARMVAGYAEVVQQVKWEEVQANLPEHALAIEFVHYKVNPSENSDSIMYAALVIKHNTDQPDFIPLFEQREMDRLLNMEGTRQMDQLDNLYASGFRGMESEGKDRTPVYVRLGKDRKSIYDLVWKKIEASNLDGIRTIYYSPSGALHRLNLGAINIDEERILADKYQMIALNSTRSLILPFNIIPNQNDAMVIGGIEYEMKAVEPQPEERPHYASRSMEEYWSESGTRGGKWNHLSWTKAEADNIFQTLKASKFETRIWTGNAASEEAFKVIGTNGSSPRILHIATHGFFFSDSEQRSATPLMAEPVFKWSDNPMIRSGLILAGGNYAWQHGRAPHPDMEDGILTAYEISQMNLSNTELVVLSACETGLGDIQGNEGVYGLQRAFKIAGAKYLIMSLWQVPDRETMEFMTSFYKNWLEGKMTIPDAFRKTQREMRDRFINPYSWAGFVLVE